MSSDLIAVPDMKPISFTDIQVKPIKGTPGWSSITVKINERQYRWDMEDAAANELKKTIEGS